MHCFHHLIDRIKETPTLRYAVDDDLMAIGFYNLRDRSCNSVTIVLRDCINAMLADTQPAAHLLRSAALAMEALRPYVEESPAGMTKTIGSLYMRPGPIPLELDDSSGLVPEALLKLRARALALPTVKSLSAIAAQRGEVVLQAYPGTRKSFHRIPVSSPLKGVAHHYSELIKALS